MVTIYETEPMGGMEVLEALQAIDHQVPFPFRPTVYGALLEADKAMPTQMRLYLADRSGHVMTWLTCRQLGAKDITPASDLVDMSIHLDRTALARWAVKMASAPAAANR